MSMGSKAGIKDSLPVNLSNAVVAGTTLITSNVIDMAQGGGYTSIAAMFLLGAVVDTAALTINAYSSPNSNGSSPTLIGSSPVLALTNAGHTNKIAAAQVIRVPDRYVYFTLTRGTANLTLQGAIGYLTESRQYPPDVSGLVGGTIYNFAGV